MSICFKFGSESIEFGVMRLPNRRRPALYRRRGANCDVLAYFQSEGSAKEFEKLLDRIVNQWDDATKRAEAAQ